MTELRVCAKRCDQCLFSSAKIVSDERRDEIVADLTKQDRHFLCHKSQLRDGGPDRVCRGSYEQNPKVVRFAHALGVPVVMVDPNTGEKVKENGIE